MAIHTKILLGALALLFPVLLSLLVTLLAYLIGHVVSATHAPAVLVFDTSQFSRSQYLGFLGLAIYVVELGILLGVLAALAVPELRPRTIAQSIMYLAAAGIIIAAPALFVDFHAQSETLRFASFAYDKLTTKRRIAGPQPKAEPKFLEDPAAWFKKNSKPSPLPGEWPPRDG